MVGVASTGYATADMVINGGFETGDFTGWALSGNTDYTGVTTGIAHSGEYAAYFGPDGSLGYLSQSLATTVGTRYELSFFLASAWGLRPPRSRTEMKRRRRRLTSEFPAKVVLEILSGTESPTDACRKHAPSPNLLGLWKSSFQERAHPLFPPDERREEDQARIAELKQLPGRATRQIEILIKPRRCSMRPRPETECGQCN
jgi:transposase-like protein